MFLMIVLYIALFGLIFLMYGIHQFILDKRYRLPPGPPPLPFVGSVLSLSNMVKPWIGFRDFSKTYGSIATFYLGQYRIIVLNDPSTVNEAIVTKGKTFANRPASFIPGFAAFPTGVLFSDGEKWLHRRRFTLKALRDFGMGKIAIVENIHTEVGYFLDEISKKSGTPFVPQRLLANTVSNVICSLVFGKRFDYDDAEFMSFLDHLQRLITRPMSRRLLYMSLPFLSFFVSPEQFVDAINLQKRVAKLLKHAVDEHREDFSGEHIRDFPDLFIQEELTNEALSFDEFALVMMDMFAAGTETTATALNWTLLFLSNYPDIQRRCHDSIDRVIDTERLPILDDRPKLVYVDAVMCEVLRYATIAPLALFHANTDEKETIAGYDIPERSLVVYNIWALHHDETYWTDPYRFNPDRWIDADGKLLTHATYFMPFGVGPRICIGQLLASVEYFVFLVALLQRFTFALADANVSLDEGIPGITYSPPKYRLIASSR